MFEVASETLFPKLLRTPLGLIGKGVSRYNVYDTKSD